MPKGFVEVPWVANVLGPLLSKHAQVVAGREYHRYVLHKKGSIAEAAAAIHKAKMLLGEPGVRRLDADHKKAGKHDY